MRSVRISGLVVAAAAATFVLSAFPTNAPADYARASVVPVPTTHRASAPTTKASVPPAPRPPVHTVALVKAAPAATTPPTTTAAPVRVTPTTSPAPVVTSPPTTQPPGGCAAALAYLAAHSAPGFRFECPGYALGHQAMTCMNVPGVCAGQKVIAIAVACQASWMNEASNSWVVTGQSNAPIDPYGYCH